MMMWNGDWGWVGWLLMTAGMVAFWALLITAIVLVVRYLTSSRGSGVTTVGGRNAEDVLAERFARGEIDDDEYQRRLTTLRHHH